MTRIIICQSFFIGSLLLVTNCGQAPDTARIEYQEVSMAHEAAEQLAELEHELTERGELSVDAQKVWDQAKKEFLSAAETLKHVNSDHMDEALEAYNTAWDKVLSTYKSMLDHVR